MSWLQLHIDIISSEAELTETILLQHGAQSVTFQDRKNEEILEPGVGETPLWNSVRATGLFANNLDKQKLSEALKGLNSFKTHRLIVEPLEDRDWEREWLKDYEPIQCGKRLWVCPDWELPPNKDAVNIVLDPGLAFGTGTHETTLLCLQWLDGADIRNKTVLDFGCGSGILGIAALLLGAQHTVFVDNDPQALVATKENLIKNKLTDDRFSILHADEFRDSSPQKTQAWQKQNHPSKENSFDLILANILANPLIELSQLLIQSLQDHGLLVMSGLKAQQTALVMNAYQPWIKFDSPTVTNNWARLNGCYSGKPQTNHAGES